MSLLRERLKRQVKLEKPVHEHEPAAAPASCSDAQRLEDNEWAPVGAVLADTQWGSFVLRRKCFSADHFHGIYAVGELAGRNLGRLLYAASEERASAKQAVDAGQWLFIDTETTGLGLGAGNLSFMTGIAYFEHGQLVVEQMLIRHPGEEAAMLGYLEHQLSMRPYLVSFNGKSFDWPILKSRFIMNRMKLMAEPQGHLDFLYPSRSLWRYVLRSCRLGVVEEERLGVIREGDVPGSMAPALYFQYLAEKNPVVLKGVFEHNELDVITLACLSIHFSKLAEGEIGWRELQGCGHEELLRHGLWLDKIGAKDRAIDLLERLAGQTIAERTGDENEHGEEEDDKPIGRPHHAVRLALAGYFKREGRYELACPLWRSCTDGIQAVIAPSLEPYIELAIYYEHRAKDYEQALHYAERAHSQLSRRQSLLRSRPGGQAGRRAASPSKAEAAAAREEEELLKRMERLRKKQAGGLTRRTKKKETMPLQVDLFNDPLGNA